jgi:hypothetical protein
MVCSKVKKAVLFFVFNFIDIDKKIDNSKVFLLAKEK